MSFWALKSTNKETGDSVKRVYRRVSADGIEMKGVFTTREVARHVLQVDKNGYPDFYKTYYGSVVKVRITVEEIT